MIKKVTVTNHLGESIPLELRFPEKSGFLISGSGIQGLGPPKANINTTEVVTMHGSAYNSAHVNQRNIVFTLQFLERPTIEQTRQNSYKYFPISQRINILVETDNRICETFGYVESNEPDIFSQNEGTVISVICPNSFFYSLEKNITEFSAIESLFEFPFESTVENPIEFGNIEFSSEKVISYSGDAPIGIVIYIHALGTATNLSIYSRRAQQYMTIIDARLPDGHIIEGDDIIISTIKGSKFVILQRDGLQYNIQNALGRNPNWFQIENGDNAFLYTCDVGATNLKFRIENQIAYEGA